MEQLKYIFRIIWRVWFYIVGGTIIIILLPVLVVLTSHEKLYPIFYKLARWWAKTIILLMGFRLEITGAEKIIAGKSYMYMANHTSMIDAMLMLAVVKNPVVFVGKYELIKLPIFGFFYKRTCILVNRSNAQSRKEVYLSAQRKINNGFGICIFPEGGVPNDESIVLDTFKNGVFSLAIEHQLSIVPMVYFDCKKHFSYTINSGGPGTLRVKVLDVIETTSLTLEDKNILNEKAFNVLNNELMNDLKIKQISSNEKTTY